MYKVDPGHKHTHRSLPITPCLALSWGAAVTTRVKRNDNMGKLQAGYLFPEVRYVLEIIFTVLDLTAL